MVSRLVVAAKLATTGERISGILSPGEMLSLAILDRRQPEGHYNLQIQIHSNATDGLQIRLVHHLHGTHVKLGEWHFAGGDAPAAPDLTHLVPPHHAKPA